jgi:hypothetical protein
LQRQIKNLNSLTGPNNSENKKMQYQIYIILKDKSTEEIKNHVKNLLKNENKKRKQLEELKISYEFPGFSSLLKHVKI